MPSQRGIRRSISTTSGWCPAASATASSPSAAVPTTSTSVEQPEQHAEALAHDPLVVGEQHPDRPGHAGSHSSTRNPSAVGAAVSGPPSSSARSRMPVSP